LQAIQFSLALKSDLDDEGNVIDMPKYIWTNLYNEEKEISKKGYEDFRCQKY
jgi:hypothetical protein